MGTPAEKLPEVAAQEVAAVQDTGTALILAEKIKPAQVFTADGIEPIIQRIEDLARAHVPDITTSKGRQEIVSLSFKVTRSKTALDDIGKDHNADIKARIKVTDAARKTARDRLTALSEEIRRPVTDWEEEQAKIKAEKERIERERVTAIGAMINENFSMESAASLQKKPSAMVHARMQRVSAIEIPAEEYQEFVTEAVKAKAELVAHLNDLYNRKLQQELEDQKRKEEEARLKAEREELDRQKAEFEQRQAEARAKEEAEAKAKAEAEAREQAEAEAREQAEAEPEPEPEPENNVVTLNQQAAGPEIAPAMDPGPDPDATKLVEYAYKVRAFVEENAPEDLQSKAARDALHAAVALFNETCDHIITTCNNSQE
jgi:colicin import membrane protein